MSISPLFPRLCTRLMTRRGPHWQIVSSIDNAPEILAQVLEVIIPIVLFTFEYKFLGEVFLFVFQLNGWVDQICSIICTT